MVLSENIYSEGSDAFCHVSFSQLLKNVFIHVDKIDDYKILGYFFTTRYLLLDIQHLPTVNIFFVISS